jgi:hypothetical protein
MTSHYSPDIRTLKNSDGSRPRYFSLTALAKQEYSSINRLPMTARIVTPVGTSYFVAAGALAFALAQFIGPSVDGGFLK